MQTKNLVHASLHHECDLELTFSSMKWPWPSHASGLLSGLNETIYVVEPQDLVCTAQIKTFIIPRRCSSRKTSEVREADEDQQGKKLGVKWSHWLEQSQESYCWVSGQLLATARGGQSSYGLFPVQSSDRRALELFSGSPRERNAVDNLQFTPEPVNRNSPALHCAWNTLNLA